MCINCDQYVEVYSGLIRDIREECKIMGIQVFELSGVMFDDGNTK